ncbi:Mitochondrial dicarboxylate transporter [Smittium mucronatum]|uniref:Mitochondrial dicarboxylate transporter n=1 Tax=Smittium mucronatum TaxID=133383 RepID=A0A1R0GMG0_9FUNG|nr:Mitochondrial dicarboxylate transporter [Smittium mucronatum]
MDKDKPPFYLGGVASVLACTVSTPGDLIKVRLQTSKGQMKSVISAATEIIVGQGITGLFTGLSAQMLRQATYSTTRFGVYEAITNQFKSGKSRFHPLKMHELIFASSVGGLLGGLVGNPFDVAVVRMQTDFKLPPSERKNYKHGVDALIKIARTEGFSKLYSGLIPNLGVSMVMTISQIASYDFFKQNIIKYSNLNPTDPSLHFISSILASLTAATAVSPIDVSKTRIMNSKTKEYNGLLDALIKIPRQEGFIALFKGWTPSFLRLAPHTILMFLILEQLKILYLKYQYKERPPNIL